MSVQLNRGANSWYVVRTTARQEQRAIDNLNASGIETFMPKVRVRHVNPYIGRVTYGSGPMFPSYVFARFDAERVLHQINYTRGVRSVVSFGHIPTKVDDSIIELIQGQIGSDGLVKRRNEITVGDRVRIAAGPLRNFVGVFDGRTNDDERVALLLTAVSYQARVVIDSDFLEKIAS